VVDDEAYNCEVLKAMLFQLKIPSLENRLTICMNGKEGLKSYKEQASKGDPFKVVLTDLSMPVMDGYKMISRIVTWSQKHNALPPIIAAITGHTEAEFISMAFEKGAD